MMLTEIYRKEIASILKCSPLDIFLYWKGRVALYAILKAMGVKEDDEIIIPAFTCVVVPNAILYLGAKPIYVDISPTTYTTDINKLEKAITPKTKAIICQNTFGLSTDIEEIIQIAKRHNAYTIEDCAHGFGGFYNGKPNGSYCDAAFYSTQWNKPFSTGIGGFLVVNNKSLHQKVNILERDKIKPSLFSQIILSLLILFNKYFVNDFTYWNSVGLFRFLSKNNLIIGSNQGSELTTIRIPKKYFKDISSIQVRAGSKQLKSLREINELRKKNSLAYTQFLRENNKISIDENLFHNHLFLKYPLIVKDREAILKLAEKERIKLGDWFLSPIHPVKNKFEQWCLNPDKFPCAKYISQRIVNLPTDIKDTQRVFKFLLRNINMIQ